MEATINESLKKSLTFINRLLAKNINFACTQAILLNNQQPHIYPSQQIALTNFGCNKDILSEISNKGQFYTSNKHPFKGFPPEIKSYTSTALISSTKKTLGFLLLLDVKEQNLSKEDCSILNDFAQIIADTIEKHTENQRLQEVFTDFIHKTVHDLKNPLTSISLTSELLKRKADDATTVINFSKRLEKASHRTLSNLENLKAAFPIENDSFKLNTKEIEIGELLADIQTKLNGKIIVHTNSIETYIYADRDRLEEAITSLIIHISLVSEAELQLKFYEKDKKVIIEARCEGSENFSSTALTIAKTIIEMHKGKIDFNEDSYYTSLPLETP